MRPPLVRLVERPPRPPAGALPAAPPPEAAAPDPATRLERDMARAVLENTAALMCVFDAGGRFLLFNRACEELSGWTAGEVLGQVVWETLVVPEERELARIGMTLTMSNGRNSLAEGTWQDRSGVRHTISWHNTVLLDEQGDFDRLVCVGVDVTDQRRAETRLRELAETDVLTGLLNRRSLFTALATELDGADGCGLLYCDLDGFKAVNDTHGHAAGDALLVAVADRVRGAVRTGDLVARLGGDEFVVLCPGADAQVLERVLERVRLAVCVPYELASGSVRVGVSIGASRGARGSSPDEVLVAADAQMYAAKRRTRQAAPPVAAGA